MTDAASTDEFLSIAKMDPMDWEAYAEGAGWSDGMPMIPPQESLVEAMVEGIAEIEPEFPPVPPNRIVPTIRSLAANAVMAGCRPEWFPVVLTALRATLEDKYNLHGTLATTHSCANMILVSGPGRKKLGINGAANCFGQGTRANAAIGRALQLIMLNIGGARPGTLDRSTIGNPAKYSLCFGENEDACPWELYHVRCGFDATDTIVTVMAAEGPHNINDHGSTSGDELLLTISQTMSQPGSNNLYREGPCVVVLGPEHAATLHRDQWSITAIQEALFERSRVHFSRVSRGNRENFAGKGHVPINDHFYLVPSPQDIHVVVAGGEGKHSAFIPSFGLSQSVTRKIPGL